jgi:phospholipid/cholesterol/gamma-HCH transport system permease protein
LIKNISSFLDILGECSYLFIESLKKSVQGKVQSHLILDQIKEIGINSIPLIAVTALSSGFVMTLQFGLGLEKFGGKPYVPKVMSLAVFMELSPVFTALMCAARVGAGIASEVGSMKVTQQIDALRALGCSPIEEIVSPRLIACLLSFPILTLMTSFLALFASAVVGYAELGLDPYFFYQKIITTVSIKEFSSGFFKAYIFAICVCIPACYYGFHVKEGTKGVGRATTLAVVAGSVLIFISDYFVTKLYWMFEAWRQF